MPTTHWRGFLKTLQVLGQLCRTGVSLCLINTHQKRSRSGSTDAIAVFQSHKKKSEVQLTRAFSYCEGPESQCMHC